MSDKNQRTIAGNHSTRRFAYLEKKDHGVFGLLEASSIKEARKRLGKGFHVCQTWLTDDELQKEDDRRRCQEIVASIFLNPMSVAFIGQRRASA